MIEITVEYLASQGLSETFPDRFWYRVNKNGPIPAHCPELGPCWVWSIGSLRYPTIRRGNATAGNIAVHRASWILHFGPIPDGLEVCHHCDLGRCVNPTHLFSDTHDGNMKDMAAKARMPRGEICTCAVLTNAQVSAIRKEHSEGHKFQRQIASEYGVSQALISLIVRHKNRRFG